MKRTPLSCLPLFLVLLWLLWSLAGCRGASAPPPRDVFSISDGTLLSYCGSETEVTLPAGVVRIGARAFEGAPAAGSVTRITLGDAVEEIHPTAFAGLPALRSVEPAPESNFFRTARDDRSGCSFLCSAEDPLVFCFPGEGHTVALSGEDAAPYFYGDDTEVKLACQGVVFRLYRHTDGDDARRWYCRAIRWRDHILEFQEPEAVSGGNYQTSVFSVHSGDVVFQRESGGSADAWLLTAGGWAELHPGDVPDGSVSLCPGADGSLRYRKILGDYAEWEQLAQLPPGVDGDALYCEEGTVSLADGNMAFAADTRQTVAEYWAARNSE